MIYPSPGEALHTIAGRWCTDGHIVGPDPQPVTGTDIYEVLPGGHFLVHHVDVTVGATQVCAIEIIGEEAPGGGYLARSFDNRGATEVMRLTIDELGVFHFEGGPDVAKAAQPVSAPTDRVRSTLRVTGDRSSMTALWERSDDGRAWHPWMDMRFTRMEQEASPE